MKTPIADASAVEKRAPIVKLIRPFQEFAQRESSGGIVLLACTLLALAWANSPWAASYTALWHTNFAVEVGGSRLGHDLHFWVNDALMAVFFFVVGLEIKRELLVGELASVKQAALPIIAALGGVFAPALLYAWLNAGSPGSRGWGIPMATDIAFAIGVMALLGSRVPLGLKVFLTALAIVDDIFAVLVIALFYTSSISWNSLGAGAIFVILLVSANRLGVRHPLVYAALGLGLWAAVLQSGVHATIAGVVLAMTIPASSRLNINEFIAHGTAVLDHLSREAPAEEQHAAIELLEDSCEKVQTPLHRLEEWLHPWVTFCIMPLFALANAGITFDGSFITNLESTVAMGVLVGLVLGKPIGITLASWIAVRARIASLPEGITWAHIHGAGWLGGIGFTMSLFIADLAFDDEGMLAMAKLGILVASVLASVVGSLLLLRGQRTA